MRKEEIMAPVGVGGEVRKSSEKWVSDPICRIVFQIAFLNCWKRKLKEIVLKSVWKMFRKCFEKTGISEINVLTNFFWIQNCFVGRSFRTTCHTRAGWTR